MNKDDVKKALAFLNDPKFLQDVAYGSKPLTIGPGKVYEIPAVLRKYIPEKLWQEYQAKHSQIDAKGNIIAGTYTGDLTKTDFIDTLKSSTGGQQKNHVALDDKSERYGHETFRLVEQVVDRLVEFDQAYTDAGDKIKQLASDCHQHLKSNYRDHIQTASQVGHHCLGHMFSTDDTDHRCPPSCNNHTKHCPECDMPERLVGELTRLYEVVKPSITDPEERLDLEYEIQTISKNIPVYVGHLARGYHETNNKARIFETLGPNEFVEVSDWKMKWLMLLMRETQVG